MHNLNLSPKQPSTPFIHTPKPPQTFHKKTGKQLEMRTRVQTIRHDTQRMITFLLNTPEKKDKQINCKIKWKQ